MKINKHILSNGLRLVHYQDLSTQMVALNIVYDVGARDEHPEHTGFAHLFEHLMFGGSVNIPDYDAPLQSAGGENNAWTNNDITNYYLTVPKSNVEIGFWLESDRMMELAFSEQSLEVQRGVVMAFHMCSREHPDYYAFDILSDILSNGRSSRLNRRLVQEQKLFSGIDAYVSGTRDAGLLHISGKPSAGVSLEQAEAAVRKELQELQQVAIEEQELEKVKNKFESTQIFGNINYLNVATNLAWFELTGQAEDIDREVERYRAVTAERLKTVAQETFREENSVVLYYEKDK